MKQSIITTIATLIGVAVLLALFTPKQPDPPPGSGRYYFQKDTTGWRLIREIPGAEKGSGTVIYSGYRDSSAAISMLQGIIKSKEKQAWETEYNDLKALLDKATGKAQGGIAGRWIIQSGADTVGVTINSLLRVAGDGISGHLEALNQDTYILRKVLPADIQLRLVHPGLLEGQNIKLIKQ